MSSKPEANPSPPRSPTPSEMERGGARYLFAVSVLSDGDERITTGELRSQLGVAPASVTEMVSKLDDRGLVDYEKYQGMTLTDRGDALASELAWRVCVVSTYFDSELGMDLDERTTFDIAFALPAEGLSNLRELVGSPCLSVCPEAGEESGECASC